MIRPVLQAPDPRLRAVSAPIGCLDTARCKIAGDLLDTMRKRRGYGLSAVQIGEPVRMCAISPASGFTFLVIVNPVITERSREVVKSDEGCFSIDEGRTRFKVLRHVAVTVRFSDRADLVHQVKVSGLAARVLQHEIDHLDGKMIGWPQ